MHWNLDFSNIIWAFLSMTQGIKPSTYWRDPKNFISKVSFLFFTYSLESYDSLFI